MLQFCISQNPDAPPFAFKATGIRVFSFEEALYHVYHYWRESVDDVLSDKMLTWVTDLGLTYLAARMKELVKIDSFADRMVGFLRLVDYFNADEINGLVADLNRWEARREWEQLKERGDYFLSRNEPAKALPLYRRALQLDENVPLLNNLAIAFMRIADYGEAVRYLARARTLEPANTALILHYAEAAILDAQFDKADAALRKAQEDQATQSDIPYLQGLMAFEQQDYPVALQYFEEANALDGSVPIYVYKMADTYLRMRQFEKALEILQRILKPDEAYYTKQAEIYAAYGNVPAAVRAIKQAISAGESAMLWVRLASYYRQDYDLDRANDAITRALSLDAENDTARLENARIKKGLGRTREYQAGLTDVLRGFKQRYREA
ncbi:MAG: tetratricopeptide repeat protein [Defluviitaleaceae bacterium]|nr:tetratricopeptide repeat protein [Defluviitaleaceae bacterium]MCL2275648.1 tetratricopeptide repeat protein [Defluviitaleaceae bacterium]